MPDHFRNQGPWQRLKSGEFDNLQREFQDVIKESGYLILDRRAGIFLGRDVGSQPKLGPDYLVTQQSFVAFDRVKVLRRLKILRINRDDWSRILAVSIANHDDSC
jgi:hypothetical protein